MYKMMYLDQHGNTMRSLELDPPVDSDDLLVSVSLHRDGPSEEEEGEGRDHGGVVEEDCSALDLRVEYDKLVVERSLVRVDRLWVELYFGLLFIQPGRPSITQYIV